MVQRLDEGMQSLAEVIKKTTGKDITNYPGAGQRRVNNSDNDSGVMSTGK